MKRKALGKGLAALLPEAEPAAGDRITEALASQLEPNPYQPRTRIDPAALESLAASIRQSGIVQPILVRRRDSGYQIIAGERRWRAAELAGLAKVPIAVREVKDADLLELALVENIQRQELGPLDEALAFQRLQDEFQLTQEQIAQRVGRERPTIANAIRLLKLPREVRTLIETGQLEAGHGRALLALERGEELLALAREAARRALSVREVERRVALLRAPRRRRETRADANTRAAEERLRAALGTPVQIRRRGKAGRLEVRFANESELNRLFELLLRAARGRG